MTMTMLQAFDLAIAIAADHPQLMVIAIGRFVPPEEIAADTPWAVNVRFQEKYHVIRSSDPEEWPESIRPKRASARSAEPAVTKKYKPSNLMLFD